MFGTHLGIYIRHFSFVTVAVVNADAVEIAVAIANTIAIALAVAANDDVTVAGAVACHYR